MDRSDHPAGRHRGAAAVYLLLGGGPRPEPTVLRGYVGEKIGLLEDEAVQDILERNYGLTLDYAKAGSLDMVTADHEGRIFSFPPARPPWSTTSSSTARRARARSYSTPPSSSTPTVPFWRRSRNGDW